MSSEDMMWKQAAAQIAELEAENARLRAALQPFADAAKEEDVISMNNTDSLIIETEPYWYTAIVISRTAADDLEFLKIHHLRAAAKALNDGS